MARHSHWGGVVWRLVFVAAGLYVLVAASSFPRRSDRQEPPPPATPVFSPETASFYQYVRMPEIDWKTAKQIAEGATHLGRRGHLATITSSAEQAFLESAFRGATDLWIGGSDAEEEGVWRWECGPEAGQVFTRIDGENHIDEGYSNWQLGEPNDYQDGEDYLLWNYSRFADYGWNDAGPPHRDDEAAGFLIEYSPEAAD